jgi:hypothetical protein
MKEQCQSIHFLQNSPNDSVKEVNKEMAEINLNTSISFTPEKSKTPDKID